MITVFDKDCHPIKTVATDEELFWYIKQESLKLQESQAKRPWQFNQYSCQLLATLLKEIQDKAFLMMARQAYTWQSDMVCIHKGDHGSCFLIATPELDLDLLKADWCEKYVRDHDLSMARD